MAGRAEATTLPPVEGPTTLDRPGEACGVFGIYAPGSDAPRLTYFGLFALQHRGQESAGISVSDGETITVYKELGLVTQVFDEATLGGLHGHIAVGHTRYSTTGSSVWENAQPAFRQVANTGIALGHNGNLTNTRALAEQLGGVNATSDSELMTEAIARAIETNRSDGRELERAMLKVLPSFEGAFSLAVMDQGHLVAVRDPHGFRPLCLGRLGRGWVVASETAALDIVGATFVREIEPGEMVSIDASGVRSHRPFGEKPPRLCVFEFVYFARPDSLLYGRDVHGARRAMGHILADEAPADADVVVPVPESGIPAAQGYSATSGIRYVDGLVKNRYIGRTFINPTPLLRERGIRMKLNPIRSSLEGRRVVLVDDSIVRGTTTKKLVQMVRDAGAVEVHLRISSPPYRWPCFYGMDTSDRDSLLAAHKSLDEIAEHLEVDSLAYLSVDGLMRAAATDGNPFCTACLTGEYPTEIGEGKFVLEGSA